MRENTKLIGSLALLAIATLAVVGLTMTGGAATAATENVTIDDPANDTVEVDVDYLNATDATVELVNASGSVVASTTESGNASETRTLSVSPVDAAAGDYTLNLTAANANDIALNETRLVAERTATVADAANETVYVDLAFQGDTNATGDVGIYNDTGDLIYQHVVNYDATDDQTTYTVEINESDGIVNGDYTANVTINPASAYDAAYTTVEEPTDDGIFGGEILGQDPTVAIAGLLVIGGGFYYAREEDYL